MSAEAEEIEIRRAPRIKAEDVFAAADALLLGGHRPTIDRVRMKLGRGSPNTINEHLDRWWSNLGARLRDLPGQVLPGLPEAVTDSLLQVWQLALRESQSALLSSLDTRETALATATSQLEQRARTFDETRAALERAITAAQTQLEEANQRARTLEATLQQRDADAAEWRNTVARVEQEVARNQSALEDERRARATERTRLDERYDAQQVRWSKEIDGLRQARKEEQKLIKELQQRLNHATAERDESRTIAAHVSADLVKAGRQREQLEAQLRALKHPARRVVKPQVAKKKRRTPR